MVSGAFLLATVPVILYRKKAAEIAVATSSVTVVSNANLLRRADIRPSYSVRPQGTQRDAKCLRAPLLTTMASGLSTVAYIVRREITSKRER